MAVDLNHLVELFTASGIGGAAVPLFKAVTRLVNARRIAARVNKEARVEGGPAYGTPGWIWNQFEARLTAARAESAADVDRLREELKDDLVRLHAELKDDLERERVELGKARSKGHSNETWCSQNAQRLAAVEETLYGSNRMVTGEQERIDWVNERRSVPQLSPAPPLPAAVNDTEPDPMPAFGPPSRRRSRP